MYIDGLAQDCSNFSVPLMELLKSPVIDIYDMFDYLIFGITIEYHQYDVQ